MYRWHRTGDFCCKKEVKFLKENPRRIPLPSFSFFTYLDFLYKTLLHCRIKFMQGKLALFINVDSKYLNRE